MVDADSISRDPVQRLTTQTKLRRYQSGSAIASQNETIPMDVGTITTNGHAIFLASDGSAVTHTIAGGTITITQAITDQLVYFLVVGDASW